MLLFFLTTFISYDKPEIVVIIAIMEAFGPSESSLVLATKNRKAAGFSAVTTGMPCAPASLWHPVCHVIIYDPCNWYCTVQVPGTWYDQMKKDGTRY